MSRLLRTVPFILALGCTKQAATMPEPPAADREKPAKNVRPEPPVADRAKPANDVRPEPSPSDPLPVAPTSTAVIAPGRASTAEVELIPDCPTGYGGSYRQTPTAAGKAVPNRERTLGFLEEAKRPIATVILGHYVYSDVQECRANIPWQTTVAIALRPRFASKRDVFTTSALAGDLLRPMFTEECVHVISCDDLNGNNVCDFPEEPQLNRVNDSSRYLYASVSRPARFTLTLSSRDDRFCERTNYYSRCCPDRYSLDIESHTCSQLDGLNQVPARCPGSPGRASP
jgi:hypothetical protein